MQLLKALNDEITYVETLKSGLTVAIHPKLKYQRTLVSLQVNFGGMDLEYTVDNQSKKIPSGVAHFLEHSLFQNNGTNLTEEFAEYGARINAYTTKSITAYTFECRTDFDYLMSYFLNSFIKPDFSKAAIEKEKKIIKHELLMSEDSVHTKIYQKLKHMMYSDNAIRCDVGGTVKDVFKTHQEILNDVFDTFYHPKNMSLIITGNIDHLRIFELLRNHAYNQHDWPVYNEIKRIQDIQPRNIHNHTRKVEDVEENIINIGIRIPEEYFAKYSREYIHIAIHSIIGNTFGLGSKNYDYLDKRKMMNISFSAKSTIERDYGFINIYMQSKQPDKYLKEIMAIIKNIKDKPLDEKLFTINKRAISGNYIRLFDSLGRTHEFISNCLVEDVKIDDYLNNILNLDIKDLDPMKQIFEDKNIFTIKYLKP